MDIPGDPILSKVLISSSENSYERYTKVARISNKKESVFSAYVFT